MRQFIRDNLLLKSGKITHNGIVPTCDETLSPTTERLIVLRWLEVLHPALINHVTNVFAHDLQTKSLKDLQPRITEQLDELLRQVDDLTANVGQAGISSGRFNDFNSRQRNGAKNRFNGYKDTSFSSPRDTYTKRWNIKQSPVKSSTVIKKCHACYSVKEPFIGHTVHNCPNIAPKDRAGMLKTFSLEIDDDADENGVQYTCDNNEAVYAEEDATSYNVNLVTSRINIEPSPQFNVKMKNTMVTMLMDTGATGSMITIALCEASGIKVYPSPHSAVQADGASALFLTIWDS